MKITINNQECELKFGYQAHKELQKLIKESNEDPAEYLQNNYPTIIKVSLRHCLPDVTIEEIETAIENINFKELNALVSPYTKYYNPNGELPKS